VKPNDEHYVLSIDIGSSSTCSAVYDAQCLLLPGTFSEQDYLTKHGQNGRAEIDAFTILNACKKTIKSSLASFQTEKSTQNMRITSIGVSCFWHSLLGVDGNFEPLTPVITWADRSGSKELNSWRLEYNEEDYHKRTGCFLHSSYWPSKLLKFGKDRFETFSRVKFWLSPGEWIQKRMFGVLPGSYSMASGTGLFDITNRCWDDELLSRSNITIDQLPELTSRPAGINPDSIQKYGILKGALCYPVIGDGAAGNLGCGAYKNGITALNYGTSAAVRIVTDHPYAEHNDRLFTYLVDEKDYLVGGATSNAGNIRKWCLENLNINSEETAEEILKSERGPVAGLDILPFFCGERAPYWRDNLSGKIVGLSLSHSSNDIFRAVVDATFLSLANIIEILPEGSKEKIVVSGGIVKSPAMLQRLADAISRDIYPLREYYASLKGAALYVLLKEGFNPGKSETGLKKIKPGYEFSEKYLEKRVQMNYLAERYFPEPGEE